MSTHTTPHMISQTKRLHDSSTAHLKHSQLTPITIASYPTVACTSVNVASSTSLTCIAAQSVGIQSIVVTVAPLISNDTQSVNPCFTDYALAYPVPYITSIVVHTSSPLVNYEPTPITILGFHFGGGVDTSALFTAFAGVLTPTVTWLNNTAVTLNVNPYLYTEHLTLIATGSAGALMSNPLNISFPNPTLSSVTIVNKSTRVAVVEGDNLGSPYWTPPFFTSTSDVERPDCVFQSWVTFGRAFSCVFDRAF